MTQPIPYGKQTIDETDIAAVVAALKSDFLTQGPLVKEFEEKFARYVDAKYAVACSNGTAALHLCALALNVKPGQKIITTPITFAASANAFLYAGAEIDFVDIDPATFLMDLDLLEKKLRSSKPGTYAGIVPVDFTGLPVNTERLRKLADEFSLWIVEDACHAPGAYFLDSRNEKTKAGSGKYSHLTCFSFHPVKHIACGEGGMVTTSDEHLYKQLITLRTHGISRENMPLEKGGWYHEMQQLGYNYRLPDMNCALGITQLAKADKGLIKRIAIAQKYRDAFRNVREIKMQAQPHPFFNAWHLFVIETDQRKALYDYLKTKNIFTQVHYIPVHLHPYYQSLGWKQGDFPHAEKYYERCLSLPMYPGLSEGEQGYVVEMILSFFNKN
ncbi:MAG: UDP-4-amino-4,6-dideoxy-N-acetyl-beta-L-altrosamine transaminase [Crocinitomicaceae bacterium]|nr:UDP-4-amino-4,6-dideoxy-N-acetyl-beta-L-altrosamine transaminase [Crocinitomicaceae bacterium]